MLCADKEILRIAPLKDCYWVRFQYWAFLGGSWGKTNRCRYGERGEAKNCGSKYKNSFFILP